MNKAYQSRDEAVMDALVNKLLTPQLPASPAFNPLQGGQNMNLAPWLIPSVAAPDRNRLTGMAGGGNLLIDAAARAQPGLYGMTHNPPGK